MAAFGPFIPSPAAPYKNKKAGDVELTLKTIAVARIVLKNVHIPATTALATLAEDGRVKGLQCGANIVMPDYTPSPYREKYEIYPNKKSTGNDPSLYKSSLQTQVESIGRKIGDSKGNSLKNSSIHN